MNAKLLPIVLCGLTVSCLSKRLLVPAEDHYVQAQAVAESCKTAGYRSDKCTDADLEALAEQAKCLLAIVRGEECDGGK